MKHDVKTREINLSGVWATPTGGLVRVNHQGQSIGVVPENAEARKYWTSGSGQYSPGVVVMTFHSPHGPIATRGLVSADGNTITWDSGTWVRHG